jgi:hypothetical protein
VLEVDYNDMLRDPEPLAASVNALIDGALDTAEMVRVVNPTLYRNRAQS